MDSYENYMANFDAEDAKNEAVKWIRKWFDENGNNCNAVIGISGGKDSTVVAGLCVEALGKDRVIGVLMPNITQSDILDSIQVCKSLDIRYLTINIGDTVNSVYIGMMNATGNHDVIKISDQTRFNLPCRIRMATLFAVAQSVNGRVSCNCNMSEDWVGFNSFAGDDVGAFAPLKCFTTDEVIEIGKKLKNIPQELITKTPSDGLCGKTDEDSFGFTYKTLNKYIRTNICEDSEIRHKIDEMHNKNLFKLQIINVPKFNYWGVLTKRNIEKDFDEYEKRNDEFKKIRKLID